MGTYIPPGWPAGVHPPGSEEFESTAVGWLLDVVPPDYRLHGVLRRYPIALATMARHHSKACVEGAREGYRTARTELAGVLPPHAVDTVLAAYRTEGARLAETARAVDLVERALRGEVFTPKMSPPPAAAGPEDAGAMGAEPGAAERKAAGRKAAGRKPAEQKPGAAKAAGKKAAAANRGGINPGRTNPGRTNRDRTNGKGADGEGADGEGTERGRPGARRNSAGRGRNDLART
jgi:hypothetical protein